MNKVVRFLELMWLMLAIVTFIIACYQSIINSVFDALYFFGFSVISIFLYLMRRKQRKLHEKSLHKD